ncbi:uncharacterized protein [Argopecten irradians]|uniref:uncharacterized protein n=1 Tax=Argopecten irradians TaxID=31199 RepID=UPI00371F04E4
MFGKGETSVLYTLVWGCLSVTFWMLIPVNAAPLAVPEVDPNKLSARIIVHVRKRRSRHWDFWQLNSNICPQSLCYSSDEGGEGAPKRPRGTGGSIFYNGDIVLDPYSEKIIFGDGGRTKRATVRNRDNLWKNGIVYYLFDRSINPLAKRAAKRAMKHISERTCIRFQKKTKETVDYVRIISEPGCWSSVGRIGGEQKLSLGRGCEREVGTAVHELLHSLGFWHEHARPDRDDYVEIVYPNISPRYVPDFLPINETLSKPRGFPYDYKSIMHYKDRTFTNNGGKTIRVIGVGKTMKLNIGQRDGMSEIDIAQLRDMYFCNQKQDKNETICPDGWEKFQTSCYLFVRGPRKQFAGGQKYCQQYNGHLVVVDSQNENKYLNDYIKENYPNIRNWRTGGRRINDTFYWDTGKVNDLEELDFRPDWVTFEPKRYTSLVLRMSTKTGNLEWRGDWVGSAKQLPKYAYSYICERPAKRRCIKGDHPDGRDYRGTLDHTRDGITCQNWTSHYPHDHKLVDSDAVEEDKDGMDSDAVEEDKDGIGPHNFCRNPMSLRRNRPWCFTNKLKQTWGYCDVSICSQTSKEKAEDKDNDQGDNAINNNAETRVEENTGSRDRIVQRETRDSLDTNDVVQQVSNSNKRRRRRGNRPSRERMQRDGNVARRKGRRSQKSRRSKKNRNRMS